MTTTRYEAQAELTNVFASTAEAEGIAAGSSSTAAPTPKRMARAYKGFLGLPVWVVLAAMWVAGAAHLGSCALVVYMVGSLLVRMIAGALKAAASLTLLPLDSPECVEGVSLLKKSL
jgi:hypothetical protein